MPSSFIRESRARLVRLTAKAEEKAKTAAFAEDNPEFENLTRNEKIIRFIHGIDPSENLELRTFTHWTAAGYRIRAGSKGLIVWGKPLCDKRTGEEVTTTTGNKFFTIAYLYSKNQIFKLNNHLLN